MKKYLRIETKNNVFYVNQQGHMRQRRNSFSAQWVFRGLQHRTKNDFIPFEKIIENVGKFSWDFFKNGKSQYAIADIDHNVNRLMGDLPVYISVLTEEDYARVTYNEKF